MRVMDPERLWLPTMVKEGVQDGPREHDEGLFHAIACIAQDRHRICTYDFAVDGLGEAHSPALSLDRRFCFWFDLHFPGPGEFVPCERLAGVPPEGRRRAEEAWARHVRAVEGTVVQLGRAGRDEVIKVARGIAASARGIYEAQGYDARAEARRIAGEARMAEGIARRICKLDDTEKPAPAVQLLEELRLTVSGPVPPGPGGRPAMDAAEGLAQDAASVLKMLMQYDQPGEDELGRLYSGIKEGIDELRASLAGGGAVPEGR